MFYVVWRFEEGADPVATGYTERADNARHWARAERWRNPLALVLIQCTREDPASLFERGAVA